MAFNAQLPSTLFHSKSDESGTTGYAGAFSCYSFIEKISGITNPITLRHDILYPNAIAAIRESNQNQLDMSNERMQGQAEGCRGHQIDNEFPLESATPFAIPLVMYPTKTTGTMLHEVDLCAEPVLNWEGYIHDNKNPNVMVQTLWHWKPKGDEGGTEVEHSESESEAEEDEAPSTSTQLIKRSCLGRDKWQRQKELKQFLIASEDKPYLKAEEYPEDRAKKYTNTKKVHIDRDEFGKRYESKYHAHIDTTKQRTKLALRRYNKLKNLPSVKVEGSWNFLYGGQNGACCYVHQKSSSRNFLFSGKGSQLRCSHLGKYDPSAKSATQPVFSYSLDSVWDEPFRPVPFNCFAKDKNPLNDVVLQIVSNERNDLLGVRRGKSIQIYSIDEESPYILENIPNIYYGTAEACPSETKDKLKYLVKDPIVTGVTFNPKYSPEVVTADENGVIRLCDIYDGETVSLYMVEKDIRKQIRLCQTPEGYPPLRLNEASGVTYSSLAHIFLGWKDSIVGLCDRRTPDACLTKVMDLRNDKYLLALSDQSLFPDRNAGRQTKLNEYISCVRASKNADTIYYVGTTSKLYTMDLRVPNRPIFRINHGLQSALTYIDTCSDDNFDMIIGGSQRFAETFCMLTDRTHTLCIDRPGCANETPVLYCYPRHLSNPRSFFDATVKEGYGFSLPSDHEMAKSHSYAWPTGLAVIPSLMPSVDFKKPRGFLVATSNNFGDIFLQEWNQKPIRNKVNQSSERLRYFMKNWKDSMTLKLASRPIPRPSKNRYQPFDLSIVVEPVAKEIEKLTKVRSTPFTCFTPNVLQFHDNQRTMIPMKDLLHKLKFYKNEKVKGILSVWSEEEKRTRETNQVEPIPEIKIEPEEVEASIISSLHTIDIDVSERGDEDEDESSGEDSDKDLDHSQPYLPGMPSPIHLSEPEERGFAEDSFITSLSQIKEESNSQDMFAQYSQVRGFEEGASRCELTQEQSIFPGSQDLFSEFQSPSSSQQFGLESQSQSSQSRKKITKPRKSGFI